MTYILVILGTCLSLIAVSNGCFPYDTKFSKVGTNIQVPTVTRDQWWCPANRFYGWLGYVRDLKGWTCSDAVYSLARLQQDFKKMADDGAKMVRIYGPICEQQMVWDNIIQAAAENNLGVLGIVWHGYSDSELNKWEERKNALMAVLKKPLSKYVIHSVSFGSEPLFSWSISGTFVAELTKIKTELKALSIPLTVSEMKYGFDVCPAAAKNAVINNIDFISAHIMPYYGTCDLPGQVWNFITNEIDAFKRMIPGKQMMITQNPWGSSTYGRNRGSVCGSDVWKGVSVEGANEYWRLWINNCQYFKQQQIGWFAHTFSADSEYNFGIYGPRNDAVPYPRHIDFKPIFC
ncbi:unnamed protein product [Adineta steineri]|uniref:glucan endo-1,3-beta-D-glucosidase n=1 Tax=Adineta steineri TaxID=433720 RepID=A0A815F0G5_9BILA|nr:unnamed protein product [Adineta steineri]CAF4063219.1 unnamed protein product [Adineta steineri]